MENLKIRVANEAENKEAKELLDILGYSKDAFENKSTPCWIAICNGLTYSDYNIGKNIWYTACPKEITIQELRDMVNPMKEYLEKQADGSYKLVMRGIVGKDDEQKQNVRMLNMEIEQLKQAKKLTDNDLAIANRDKNFMKKKLQDKNAVINWLVASNVFFILFLVAKCVGWV